MRKERLLVFKNFVQELATLSKCQQRGVAAIILNDDLSQVYSIGINGGPKHGVDCLCSTGKYTCVHAEANAIAKDTSSDPGKVILCTLSPCVTCAALIINSGISRVYYIEQWKDTQGLELLHMAGIPTRQI